jgi:hypothetical protein
MEAGGPVLPWLAVVTEVLAPAAAEGLPLAKARAGRFAHSPLDSLPERALTYELRRRVPVLSSGRVSWTPPAHPSST